MSTKVLVISNNAFSNQKNNGKTLLSFFKDVAKKNLQQIFFSGEAPDCDCARGYFRISDSDVVKSIIKPGKKAGSIINYETGIKATPSSNQKAKATTLLREYESIRLLREVAWALSPKNEVELERWVVDFSPDVVFFCAGDSGFAYDVYEKVCKFLPGSKKCIYITDDYILPRPTISLFWWIRRQIVLNKMKRSVTASDIFVTISEKMRSEYKKIFGVDSIVAFNMPESIRVEGFVKSEREDLVLVYAGGLHFNRWKTLKRLGEALDIFNRENDRQVTLKIYSHQDLSRKVQEALSTANSSEFAGSLDNDGVRCALNDADILVHVESFSKRNVYSTRLSVSTKISEYLMAGKPVLAIGPSELASMEFLSTRGFCINSNKDLKNKLKEFLLSDRSVELGGEEQELDFLANEREFKQLVLTSGSLQSKRRNDQE